MKAKRSRWRDGGPPNHEIKNTKYPTGRSQDSTCSKFTDWIVFTGAKIKRRSLKKKASQANWRKILQVVHQYTNPEGVSFMNPSS